MARSNGCRGSPAGEIEQLLAGEDALRPFDESEKDIELGGAQIDQRAGRRVELAARHIEAPAGELVHPIGAGRCAGHRNGDASQHRTDAGEQLARAEGLRQVVVGAHFEADDAVGLRRRSP